MNSIEDEIALRNLMATYVDAANRRDGELWKSTWAEDGVWCIMGMDVIGRDNILSMWQQVLQTFEFALLLPSSGQFSVDGDSATGHWYLQEYTRDNSGQCGMIVSRYLDTYSRVEGQWLYQSRRYELIYQGPADFPGTYTAPA